MSTTLRTSPTHLRAGLSLLEVVFATALLGLLVMATMAAISYVQAAQMREQRMLAANELANRLVLMYIDDPNSPWNEGDILTWGNGEKYRWELIRSSIEVNSAVQPPVEASATPSMTMSGVHLLRARVWLDAESGGTAQFALTTPHAELSRLMSPMANATRPDTSQRMFETYGASREYFESGRLSGWRGRDGAPPSGGK